MRLALLCSALLERADPADLSWQLSALEADQENVTDDDTAEFDQSPEPVGPGPSGPRVVLLATGGAVARLPVELERGAVELESPSPIAAVRHEPRGLRARLLDLGAATRALSSMPQVESQQFWDSPTAALASIGPVLHSHLVAVQTHASSRVLSAAQGAGISVPLFVMGFVAVMVATLVLLSVLLTPSKAGGPGGREPLLHGQVAPEPPGARQSPQLSSRLSARSARGTPWNVLCRELVVPHGNEFLFAMKSAALREAQSDSFEVVDPDNFGFCAVVLAERPGDSAFFGMQGVLLRVGSQPLAFMDTSPLFQRRSSGQMPLSRRALAGDSIQLPIYRATREVFGTFQLEGDVPRRYSVRVDGSLLMSFHGDFRESAVTVHNAQGQLIATTEKHTFSFSLEPHIQVRAAQLVDTSVLMLGLLAAAKME